MNSKIIKTNEVELNNWKIGGKNPLTIFAGPNVIEETGLCIEIANKMKSITKKYGYNYIFKSSYYKPNRTDYGPKAHKGGYMGPGFEKGLEVLKKIIPASKKSVLFGNTKY